MNHVRLQIFEAVMRHGTFAAAAEALSFTPSAVSQQMARLEEETGTSLFRRSPRGVEPTPAGALLHERAVRILDEVREAHAELASLARLQRGTVRLGCFSTATQTVVAEVLRRYRVRHSGIEVHVRDSEPWANLELLRARELDLAVVFAFDDRPLAMDYQSDRQVAADDEVEVHPLFAEPFVAVLPDGHPLAEHEQLDVGALRGHQVVGGANHPGFTQFVDAAAAAGFALDFTGDWTFDYQSVRALVISRDAVGLLPELATRRAYPGTVVRPFAPGGPTRSVAVARRRRGFLPAAAAAMLVVLEEVAGEYAARSVRR